VEKFGENNQKAIKTNQTISQMFAPRLKHDNSNTMGLRYPIKKHVRKGMMVQMLQDGILKLNHLFPNELFKKRMTFTC
jgi:hypothetical protein